MTQHIIDWITLSLATEYIGNVLLQKLLAHVGYAEKIIAADISFLTAAGLSPEAIQHLKNPNPKKIAHTLQWLAQPQHHLITLEDEYYPPLLREIHNPPALLYIEGDPSHLLKPQLAIVGSRRPTHQGHDTAVQFAYELAKLGFVVTSGMALGIDAASHRGALRAQKPTIAVLGSGLTQIYPKCNHTLSSEIISLGALVSEFPLSTQAMPFLFPLRNRIISGLSVGTLVVEAAERSGSLITAQLASEQGRDVFALPGSVRNPLSRGCHQLIKQGAKLCTSAQDILDELNVRTRFPSLFALCPVEKLMTNPHYTNLTPPQQQLLQCVDFELTLVDQVVARSGFSVAEVTSMLLILELHGYIRSESGSYRRNIE